MANTLICRTCLKKERPENCKNISPEEETDETSNILEMLNYCVPELDIYLVLNPVICKSCVTLLETAFKFKTECLKIEEKFLKFSHSMNSKVDLNNFYKNVHVFNNNANTINKNKETTDIKIVKVERISPIEDVEKSEVTKNKAENDGKIPQFSCQKCYGCENNLADPSYHSKEYKSPYKCYNCGKEVNTISECRKHMMCHSRPRKCKICDRFFRDLHQLTTHLRTHTGARPFTCNICSKAFRQKHSLDQHIRQHQGHSTVKCKICNKALSTKYNLKIHMWNVHIKKPECELCGEKFRTKAALIKHLETDSETCGNFVKKEVSDEPTEEQIIVKTEPEFIVANDILPKLYKEENSENDQVSTLDEDVDILN